MVNNKLSATPPSITEVESVRETFIKAAEVSISKPTQPDKYPWEDEKVREDIRKAFTVTLPEAYILKLKYISEQTNKSQQKIARESLCAAIDKLLLELS